MHLMIVLALLLFLFRPFATIGQFLLLGLVLWLWPSILILYAIAYLLIRFGIHLIAMILAAPVVLFRTWARSS